MRRAALALLCESRLNGEAKILYGSIDVNKKPETEWFARSPGLRGGLKVTTN